MLLLQQQNHGSITLPYGHCYHIVATIETRENHVHSSLSLHCYNKPKQGEHDANMWLLYIVQGREVVEQKMQQHTHPLAFEFVQITTIAKFVSIVVKVLTIKHEVQAKSYQIPSLIQQETFSFFKQSYLFTIPMSSFVVNM